MEQVASIICGDLASSNQETIGQLDFRCGPLSYDCPLHLQVTSYKLCGQLCVVWCISFRFFTALHVMQTRYCDENSVRPSVCHTRVL